MDAFASAMVISGNDKTTPILGLASKLRSNSASSENDYLNPDIDFAFETGIISPNRFISDG